MPWSFIIPAAASLLGGVLQGDAAEDTANISAAASDRAAALQQRVYEESVARQRPFLDTGTEFYNRLAELNRGGPEAASKFLMQDPGYGFRFSEGLKALDRQASARGGLISGGALKAAQRYGQDYASGEFGNAHNRLAGMAAMGPNAAGIVNSLGQNFANNVGNLYTNAAADQGNARMARGSAYTNALGGIASIYGRSPWSKQPGGGGGGITGLPDWAIDPYGG